MTRIATLAVAITTTALTPAIAQEAEVSGDELIEAVLEPDTDGLEAIRERGYVRMAVAPDPLMIAFDGEAAIGVAIAMAQEIEKYLATLPDATGTPTVVVPTPMPRAEIVARLEAGESDFTTLTVSQAEENDALDYTTALIRDVNDVPVLGPDVGGVETIDDLVDIPIYVQQGGRYDANLRRLNETREAKGKAPLDLRFVDERLDDYDLIEMVEVGIIPATVASDFKANFWSTVYTSVDVRSDMRLTEDGRIAWALRAENPALQKALDGFAETAKKGTLLGNIILNRYTTNANWIENIATNEARTRIAEVGPVIEKYATEYEFDPELVLAQAYQESRLDQNERSHVGAIGVMQVMPATAADPVVGIPDVTGLDDNVRAGVKYLRFLRDEYFSDPEIEPLDQTLLSFAAYNAGPGGVQRAQKRAVEMGLDPNIWFENVEVAIQRAVSREPAIYVRNIFKYYVSYRLLAELEAEAEAARAILPDVDEVIDEETAEELREVIDEEVVVETSGEGDNDEAAELRDRDTAEESQSGG